MTSHAPPLICRSDLDPDFLPAGLARVGWDIETSGLDWARDRIASCQISLTSGAAAVVRVGHGRVPGVLRDLLADRGVLKVFHHAPFDLRFLTAAWGVTPRNVACTKVASKLLAPQEPDHSLKALLRRHLNVTIDKALRVSDWVAEEWTDGQMEYAVGDVLHLHDLYDTLMSELRAAGRDELATRCFEHIPTRVRLETGKFGDVFAY